MSAIVAAAARSLRPETREWVPNATAFSRYAGPHGDAVRLDGCCGLGHAQLRTSAADLPQPVTLDGDVWLTGDVRLDDRLGLRGDLRAQGREPSIAASDAELILLTYASWGEACVEHLTGEFAFALWDARRLTLFCARDQLGVAQLHYVQLHDELIVATVIHALLLHPAVSDDLDEGTLADFLILGRGSGFDATAFASLKRIPPAHALTWSDGTTRLRRYWQPPEWERLARFPRREQYAARFRALLDEAVADRVTTDRLAVQLSGGMDSTSVAASARATLVHRGAPADAMLAVTAVLGGTSGDREGEYAALVAESLEVALQCVDGASLPATDPFDAPLPLTPEPTPYRWTPHQHEFARSLAAHAPVALTGIGGDALLKFVPRYWLDWLAHGQALRVARAFGDHVRLLGARPHPHLRPLLKQALERPAIPPLPGWLDADFAARTGAEERRLSLVRPIATGWDARSLVREPLWSTLFTWGDPSFTQLPVRFRHPLVDLRLLRFVLSLPPEPWLVDKRILREANSGTLPEAIRRRPKTPLVRAPRPGTTPAAVERVVAFVRDAPGAERFVDRAALVAAARRLAAAPEHERDREMALPVGLLHWLAHWRRPVYSSAQKVPELNKQC